LFNDFVTKKQGNVFYRETTDPSTLLLISDSIKLNFIQTPNDLVLSSTFIVTWFNIPFYGEPNSYNTFQLVLASFNSCYSYIIFNFKSLTSQSEFKSGFYHSNQINYELSLIQIEAFIKAEAPMAFAFKIKSSNQC
jgi:hypothetical protein